ncbi:PREDICTED: uncharacterized protein LOC109486867 [Branchiostoma belcheri]|uniref:Uncharacterized protein LOC109486867 n=1 Tax=Branchiostoma belcheri TaxID=7741 RepID=A0A6P5AWI5_BRABE|nr:PREDICTED: uncharacterized protein LOC109486867 [Branchiostoma belcheri]
MKLLLLLAVLGAAAAAEQSSWSLWWWWPFSDSVAVPHWNDLKVGWGINPLTSFQSLPRTRSEATKQGWTMYGRATCAGTYWQGLRMIYQDDPAVILLFDRNGFIAGMQMGVKQSDLPADRSVPPRDVIPPWVQDRNNDMWLITTYFVRPDTICTVGRTATEFEAKGTGTDLYLQIGASPRTDFVIIPKYEKDIQGTDWTPGKCFWTMGKHYFKNLRENMRCEELYPLFPLYNDGKLNAFGLIVGASVPSPTSRYESPIASKTFYQLFMTPVPKCLQRHTEEKGLTTLHVFLESDPRLNNFC